MPSAVPDRLSIEKGDREKYYDKVEIFKDKSRKEQFFLAMSLGFKNRAKCSLDKKEGFFLSKDLHSEDEALLNALAVSDTKSVEILADRKEVFRVAEEYAHAGIRLLTEKIEKTQYGSFWKHFEKDLTDSFEKML